MKSVTTHQAKTQLSQLIEQVRAGEEITILRGSVPVARLVPITQEKELTRPKLGKITSDPIDYADDAFAPLTDEELKDWDL